MKPPRGLSAQEAALWARVAATVTPLEPARHGQGGGGSIGVGGPEKETLPDKNSPVVPAAAAKAVPVKARAGSRAPVQAGGRGPAEEDRTGLDSHWERRLARAQVEPDLTLDLHGHTLEQAHRRLESGLTQALAMNARMVLVITGKARPVHAADRGHRRGAIRANILDWLAAGPHAGAIAAVRKAHPRHGGDGALYLVLRRTRR